jgi:hypothetical protein
MKDHSNEIDDIVLKVSESIERNFHILENSKVDYKNKISYNGNLLLSDCMEFLEAVKNEIGGEIIKDPAIGTFLYYNNEDQSDN